MTVVGCSGSLPAPESPGIEEAFSFRTLAEGTWQLGPFEVTTARVNPSGRDLRVPVPAVRAGAHLSANTGESLALVRLANQADLLLSEASFLDGRHLPRDLHLTARQAAEHAG